MGKVKISYDEAVKLGLTKECSKCHRVKSVEEFSRQKKGKYGAESKCKECKTKYYQNNKEEIANRYKQYYQNNKEEIANRHKQYYQNNKEEIASQKKQYRQNNKEEIANRYKQYYQNNKEEIANRHKQYYQTPEGKDVARKSALKHKASKHNSFHQPFTQEDKEFCLNYFNYTCPYTGKQLSGSEIHIDHIVALSDKNGVGATAPWNLIICDSYTNKSKSNKPVLEFINSLPNSEDVYNKIRGYIILQAKRYIDIIPEDDVTLKTFNITFEELEASS